MKNPFDHIYDRPLPDAYFSALRPLRYRMPHHAQPIFRRAAMRLARLRGRRPVRMLDLCCGYGVNGALATCHTDMEELYRRFRRSVPDSAGSVAERLETDARFFAARRMRHPPVRVTGMDVAGNALDYALRTGLIERAVKADLERDTVARGEKQALASADLITVTGGFSYIGAETFRKILSLYPSDRLPWVIAFPLRHTDFGSCTAMFEDMGMAVETWSHAAFPHRLFEDEGERARILDAIDPDDDPISRPPSRTHMEAVLYAAMGEQDAELVCPREHTDRQVAPVFADGSAA